MGEVRPYSANFPEGRKTMSVSKAQQKAVARYEAKVYDKTLIRLPKGQLDEIKSHAAARGESVNGFIGRAITETMERDNAPQSVSNASERDSGGGGIRVPSDAESPSEDAENAVQGRNQT